MTCYSCALWFIFSASLYILILLIVKKGVHQSVTKMRFSLYITNYKLRPTKKLKCKKYIILSRYNFKYIIHIHIASNIQRKRKCDTKVNTSKIGQKYFKNLPKIIVHKYIIAYKYLLFVSCPVVNYFPNSVLDLPYLVPTKPIKYKHNNLQETLKLKLNYL